MTTQDTLTELLSLVPDRPLNQIDKTMVDRVVRRVVDGQELAPKLDVAAFNSAV